MVRGAEEVVGCRRVRGTSGRLVGVLRVGLTGGIGSGKSTVAATLAELGALVIDADAISREVVAPGTEGLAAVVDAFGEELLDADGALDRSALASVVFHDDEARRQLTAILHPRIGARTAEMVADATDDAIVVHDVPLLVENAMGAAFALVVVVDAPVDVRVRRLADSRGMSHEDSRARMAAQADDEARRDAADVWIDNGGPAGDAREAVARLWNDRLVPFEAHVRAARVAPTPETVVDADPEWPRQARRLAARVAVAGSSWVERVEHVGPTADPDRPAPDVIDLLVRTSGPPDPEALTLAGFPPVGPVRQGRYGSADPGRPARLQLRST